MYFLDSKDTSILYGDTTASHPEPKALYQRESVTEEERKTKALDSRISKKWIPNAYLFDPKFYRKDNGDFDPNTKNAAKEDIQHFIDLVKQNLSGWIRLHSTIVKEKKHFTIAEIAKFEAENGIAIEGS